MGKKIEWQNSGIIFNARRQKLDSEKEEKQLVVRKEFIPANHQLLFKIYLEEQTGQVKNAQG